MNRRAAIAFRARTAARAIRLGLGRAIGPSRAKARAIALPSERRKTVPRAEPRGPVAMERPLVASAATYRALTPPFARETLVVCRLRTLRNCGAPLATPALRAERPTLPMRLANPFAMPAPDPLSAPSGALTDRTNRPAANDVARPVIAATPVAAARPEACARLSANKKICPAVENRMRPVAMD